MELSEFIKTDIVNFLDEIALDPNNLSVSSGDQTGLVDGNFAPTHSSNFIKPDLSSVDSLPEDQVSTYMLNEDYEKEFSKALAIGDVTKSKFLIKELNKKFLEYPVNSPEKREIKQLIQDLYSKFKDYIDGNAVLTNEFSSFEVEDSSDWNDMPLPNTKFQSKSKSQTQSQFQTSPLSLSKTKSETKSEIESETKSKTERPSTIRKPVVKSVIQRPVKNIKDIYKEEKLLLEKEKQLIKEKQKTEAYVKKTEEAEKYIHAKIKLINQLIVEDKLFEATAEYKRLKDSNQLLEMRPERRLALMNSIKHLYTELRLKIERQYEKKLSHEKSTYANEYSYLEGNINRLAVSGKQKEAIIKYKDLLSFIKEHPELKKEKLMLKKLYVNLKKLFEKQKLEEEKDKNRLKNSLLFKKKELLKTQKSLREKQLGQQNNFSNNVHIDSHKQILSQELKKLKGRP